MRIDTNTAYAGTLGSTAGVLHRERWEGGTLPSADMAVQATIAQLSTGGYSDLRVMARWSGATSFYELRVNNAGEWYVNRVTAGGETDIASGTGLSLSLPEVWRLEVTGPGATVSITVRRGGAVVSSFSDAAGDRITTGNQAGMGGYTAGGSPPDIRLDDWSAESVSAPASADRRAQPIIGPARRPTAAGRVVLRRAPQAPITSARPRQPIVVLARARRRAQEILNLRAPAPLPDVVSVPAAAQVTEPRSRRPINRPAILTRNRTAAPATAVGPREPLVVAARNRRPLAPVLLRRGADAPAAPPRPRPALVVAARAGRPLARAILRRSPQPPAPPHPPIVVARPSSRRRPAITLLRGRAPAAVVAGPPVRLPLVVVAKARRLAARRPQLLKPRSSSRPFVGGLNVLLQIQTLTKVRPSQTTDAYGNTVLSYGAAATRTTFQGWVQQDMRVESRPTGRNPAEQRWLLMCNLDDLSTDDRIEWPSGHPAGPLTFAVEGPPEPAYRPPGTGAGGFHHVEATLRLLEG